jgi:LysR family glycine cleavage system transcriptional activator
VRSALGLLAAMPQHRRAAQRVRRLRVSAPPTFARQVLVPELETFTAGPPGHRAGDRAVDPVPGRQPRRADVEVRTGDAPAGRLLLDDVVLPMAAPALLARLPPLRRRPTCRAPRCCARRSSPGHPGSAPPAWTGRNRPAAPSWSTWA